MADGSDGGNSAVIAAANAKQSHASVGRGEVGKGTPGSRLKSQHRAIGKGLSLKTFAKDLADKNEDVGEWLDNKAGATEKKAKAAKEKARGGTIRATALASKAARSKGKK